MGKAGQQLEEAVARKAVLIPELLINETTETQIRGVNALVGGFMRALRKIASGASQKEAREEINLAAQQVRQSQEAEGHSSSPTTETFEDLIIIQEGSREAVGMLKVFERHNDLSFEDLISA